jgi:hypothetical protein
MTLFAVAPLDNEPKRYEIFRITESVWNATDQVWVYEGICVSMPPAILCQPGILVGIVGTFSDIEHARAAVKRMNNNTVAAPPEIHPPAAESAPDILQSNPILRFFHYEHLPVNLLEISRPFAVMAHDLVRILPPSAERTVALRKLLESKDAAVRAALPPLSGETR